MTYLIPQSNMNALQEKIDVLNRKAVKLHCSPIVLDVVGTQMVKIADLGIDLLHFEINVIGDSPIINGWAFIAILRHTSEGNIIANVPGMVTEHELVAYRDADPICEKCGYNRKRNDTFILRHIETGEHKQVGRNCLKDFLGHKSPEEMAAYAELLTLAGDSCHASAEDAGGRIEGIGTFSYLKWVARAIRAFGWVSSKKAWDENRTKTAQTALSMIDAARKYKNEPRPEAADEARAKEALAWIRELEITDQTSDYVYNLSVACKSDSIPWKQCALVASLFIAYDIAHNTTYGNTKAVSQYQGKIGEKIERVLTVKRVNYTRGAYGTTTIYAMEDTNGNQYTWFSTKDVLTKGETYTIVGTVKDQNDRFQSIKTTVLSYCKAIRVQGAA